MAKFGNMIFALPTPIIQRTILELNNCKEYILAVGVDAQHDWCLGDAGGRTVVERHLSQVLPRSFYYIILKIFVALLLVLIAKRMNSPQYPPTPNRAHQPRFHMSTSLLHFICVLLSLSLLTRPIQAAEGEDSPNEFVNPPAPGYQFDFTKNPTYAIGAPVSLQ
ncbi:hypothetical protein LTR37_019520 [Vermiconidia calcicola]|uniref:Uncharacterized protein n=1 Tax=Vermiconidia calcicola TaxID=1690605 RepID=A0ACC3MDY2_9PEZI|nr:hypothetical protein LTR37_019520 [Vermiconidia calcicola]